MQLQLLNTLTKFEFFRHDQQKQQFSLPDLQKKAGGLDMRRKFIRLKLIYVRIVIFRKHFSQLYAYCSCASLNTNPLFYL
jgi:hypothetical protein